MYCQGMGRSRVMLSTYSSLDVHLIALRGLYNAKVPVWRSPFLVFTVSFMFDDDLIGKEATICFRAWARQIQKI